MRVEYKNGKSARGICAGNEFGRKIMGGKVVNKIDLTLIEG